MTSADNSTRKVRRNIQVIEQEYKKAGLTMPVQMKDGWGTICSYSIAFPQYTKSTCPCQECIGHRMLVRHHLHKMAGLIK